MAEVDEDTNVASLTLTLTLKAGRTALKTAFWGVASDLGLRNTNHSSSHDLLLPFKKPPQLDSARGCGQVRLTAHLCERERPAALLY